MKDTHFTYRFFPQIAQSWFIAPTQQCQPSVPYGGQRNLRVADDV
ncbi:hypothetical protein [Rosenbergiella collisarenosi]|nr:hypothetical protein [Rosenbergiella collisarenosi]